MFFGYKAGVRIGDHDLEEELGRGAFGRVYRARDTRTGAVRAVKVLDASAGLEAARKGSLAKARRLLLAIW